jgi:hypothetical protein
MSYMYVIAVFEVTGQLLPLSGLQIACEEKSPNSELMECPRQFVN